MKQPAAMLVSLLLAGNTLQLHAGQQAPAEEAGRRFEVASVRPVAPNAATGRIRMASTPAGITYVNVSLREVISKALAIRKDHIAGPGWLDSDRFDIVAKYDRASAKGEQEQRHLPEMLQHLLSERFQFKWHKEIKTVPVYELVTAKAAKLPRQSSLQHGMDAARRASRGIVVGNGNLQAIDTTMEVFADMLSSMLDQPVIDKTGLTGFFSFNLSLTMEDMAGYQKLAQGQSTSEGAPALGFAPSIFSAIEEIGLKLHSRKAPREEIVIDHVLRTPASN